MCVFVLQQGMSRLNYVAKDARSIPMAGNSSGQAKIGPNSSVEEGALFLIDAENGATHLAVGSHLQYLVNDQ